MPGRRCCPRRPGGEGGSRRQVSQAPLAASERAKAGTDLVRDLGRRLLKEETVEIARLRLGRVGVGAGDEPAERQLLALVIVVVLVRRGVRAGHRLGLRHGLPLRARRLHAHAVLLDDEAGKAVLAGRAFLLARLVRRAAGLDVQRHLAAGLDALGVGARGVVEVGLVVAEVGRPRAPWRRSRGRVDLGGGRGPDRGRGALRHVLAQDADPVACSSRGGVFEVNLRNRSESGSRSDCAPLGSSLSGYSAAGTQGCRSAEGLLADGAAERDAPESGMPGGSRGRTSRRRESSPAVGRLACRRSARRRDARAERPGKQGLRTFSSSGLPQISHSLQSRHCQSYSSVLISASDGMLRHDRWPDRPQV